MTAGARRRWALWSVLLLGAAWLAYFGDKTPAPASAPDLAQPVARKQSADRDRRADPSASTSATLTPEAQLAELLPRSGVIRVGAAKVDLFSTRNWTPAPPPIVSAPAAPPTAPPLPYAYAGKKHEAGQWEVYLTRGDALYIVRQGAVIDGTYSVELVKPPTLTLRYQPLDQAQRMQIGE